MVTIFRTSDSSNVKRRADIPCKIPRLQTNINIQLLVSSTNYLHRAPSINICRPLIEQDSCLSICAASINNVDA